MRMMSRFAALAAAVLLIASCGKGAEQPAPGPVQETPVPAAGENGEPETKPAAVTIKYYVTDDLMLGLKEKQTVVEPAQPDDVYRLAMDALQRSDEAAGEYSLWKNAEFLRVERDGGVLTVDLSLPGEARLGSMGESLAVEAITRTAFQFDEIDALQILVDGEQVESLMGHDVLAHPIKRGAYPDDLNFRTVQTGEES